MTSSKLQRYGYLKNQVKQDVFFYLNKQIIESEPKRRIPALSSITSLSFKLSIKKITRSAM